MDNLVRGVAVSVAVTVFATVTVFVAVSVVVSAVVSVMWVQVVWLADPAALSLPRPACLRDINSLPQ
jgi:hypothetical protein